MRLMRWGLDKLPIPAHALKTRRVNKACWWVALCIRCAVQLRAAFSERGTIGQGDWGGPPPLPLLPFNKLDAGMQANCKGQNRREIGDMWPLIWPQGIGKGVFHDRLDFSLDPRCSPALGTQPAHPQPPGAIPRLPGCLRTCGISLD